MKRTWTLTLLQHEQPGEKVWRELVRVATRWNESEEPKFTRVAEFMWHVNFDPATKPRMDRLLAQLDEMKRSHGATYHLASRSLLEEGDYAQADFIEILGVGLGSSVRPFLVNESSAFAPPVPCPRCGAQDAFSARQQAPFEIEEKLLDEPNGDLSKAPAGGWDLVNLANGQKLISIRFARLLTEHQIKGYDLVETIDRATRRPSKRMFQLAANRAILVPCPEHTTMEGGSFCPECGTALGTIDGFFWIRDDWIDDDEIVARHPNRSAMLYVSRRLYDLLLDARLNGIHRNDVLRVCQHKEPARP